MIGTSRDELGCAFRLETRGGSHAGGSGDVCCGMQRPVSVNKNVIRFLYKVLSRGRFKQGGGGACVMPLASVV